MISPKMVRHRFQYYPLSRRKVFKNLNIRIAEGKFPEKDNEILIGDLHKATSMNVEIQTIKIDNHFMKSLYFYIIDKQEAQLLSFHLANRIK